MKKHLAEDQREMAKNGEYMTVKQLEKWILNWPNSKHYDQSQIDKAIYGESVDGKLRGGLMSRARAVYKIDGRPLSTVSKQFRYEADLIPYEVKLLI